VTNKGATARHHADELGYSMVQELKMGDPDPIAIYCEVGMALTQWELMESALADIFAFLVGGVGDGAQRAYGSIAGFGMRKGMLREAHECYSGKHFAHFSKLPGLLKRAEILVAKRNEVAHGSVVQKHVQDLNRGYFLGASRYNSAKNPSQKDRAEAFINSAWNKTIIEDLGVPIKSSEYELTAAEIRVHGMAFAELGKDLIDLLHGAV
jgi:hypothetical protein